MVDTAAKQNTAAKTTSRPLRRLFHGDKTMRYIFKVNGQPSRDSFPTREAATAAAFLFAGTPWAGIVVRVA